MGDEGGRGRGDGGGLEGEGEEKRKWPPDVANSERTYCRTISFLAIFWRCLKNAPLFPLSTISFLIARAARQEFFSKSAAQVACGSNFDRRRLGQRRRLRVGYLHLKNATDEHLFDEPDRHWPALTPADPPP